MEIKTFDVEFWERVARSIACHAEDSPEQVVCPSCHGILNWQTEEYQRNQVNLVGVQMYCQTCDTQIAVDVDCGMPLS